jgi:hypothetical protein
VAETGGDMSRFPSAAHLCSWGAMRPGQNESASSTGGTTATACNAAHATRPAGAISARTPIRT